MVISAARVVALVIAAVVIVFALSDRSSWTKFWAEQGVYSTVVTIVNQTPPRREFMVRNYPTDCNAHVFRWDKLDALSNLNGLKQDTLTNFIDANGEDAVPTSFWRLRQDVDVLDESDIDRLVPERPYGTFSLIGYIPAERDLVSLSRVGFDSSLQQGLICAEVISGRAGGSGLLMLFNMRDGGWGIEGVMVTW